MAVVNYQTLNICELLHLLPCDLLRNNVRLIEKLNKRFINAKYGKNFNETCIYERLFPKFANIYIYIYHVSCLVEINCITYKLGVWAFFAESSWTVYETLRCAGVFVIVRVRPVDYRVHWRVGTRLGLFRSTSEKLLIMYLVIGEFSLNCALCVYWWFCVVYSDARSCSLIGSTELWTLGGLLSLESF